MVSSEKITLARLTFQNVPTKSGGVVSGNISTGAGSPFGSGGKYEKQIANIKAEIAKKPIGYYDPPPNTLWKGNNPVIEAKLEDDPAVQKARERLKNLIGTYDPSHPRASNLGRYGSPGEIFVMEQKINQQYKIISDIRERLTAEKNAPIIQAQQEQEAREADLIRKLEIELAVQQALEKQVINQRPIVEPTAPAITSSLPIIPIIIIAVIVGFFLLRRRA